MCGELTLNIKHVVADLGLLTDISATLGLISGNVHQFALTSFASELTALDEEPNSTPICTVIKTRIAFKRHEIAKRVWIDTTNYR